MIKETDALATKILQISSNSILHDTYVPISKVLAMIEEGQFFDVDNLIIEIKNQGEEFTYHLAITFEKILQNSENGTFNWKKEALNLFTAIDELDDVYDKILSLLKEKIFNNLATPCFNFTTKEFLKIMGLLTFYFYEPFMYFFKDTYRYFKKSGKPHRKKADLKYIETLKRQIFLDAYSGIASAYILNYDQLENSEKSLEILEKSEFYLHKHYKLLLKDACHISNEGDKKEYALCLFSNQKLFSKLYLCLGYPELFLSVLNDIKESRLVLFDNFIDYVWAILNHVEEAIDLANKNISFIDEQKKDLFVLKASHDVILFIQKIIKEKNIHLFLDETITTSYRLIFPHYFAAREKYCEKIADFLKAEKSDCLLDMNVEINPYEAPYLNISIHSNYFKYIKTLLKHFNMLFYIKDKQDDIIQLKLCDINLYEFSLEKLKAIFYRALENHESYKQHKINAALQKERQSLNPTISISLPAFNFFDAQEKEEQSDITILPKAPKIKTRPDVNQPTLQLVLNDRDDKASTDLFFFPKAKLKWDPKRPSEGVTMLTNPSMPACRWFAYIHEDAKKNLTLKEWNLFYKQLKKGRMDSEHVRLITKELKHSYGFFREQHFPWVAKIVIQNQDKRLYGFIDEVSEKNCQKYFLICFRLPQTHKEAKNNKLPDPQVRFKLSL